MIDDLFRTATEGGLRWTVRPSILDGWCGQPTVAAAETQQNENCSEASVDVEDYSDADLRDDSPEVDLSLRHFSDPPGSS